MKDWGYRILRWSIPLAIVAYLIYDVRRQENFDRIWTGSKDWALLVLALLLFLIAHLLTIARWYWLVRALVLPFRWNDAVRLGFLGYLLTFVSPGAVGGDLLKAFFVAREQPGRRIEAFATVIVDRIFGLYSLLLLAAGAILFSGMWREPASPTTRILSQIVLLVTALATAGIVSMLSLGGLRGKRLLERFAALPRIGPLLKPLASAVQVYRSELGTVITSIAVGLVVQSLLAACVWATAAALVPNAPTMGQHLIIVPLALLTTMLPLPGYGLGAFEFGVEFLYRHVAGADAGYGLLVALGFRLVMIATAVISAVVYASNRREVAEVLREAEAEADAERLAAGV